MAREGQGYPRWRRDMMMMIYIYIYIHHMNVPIYLHTYTIYMDLYIHILSVRSDFHMTDSLLIAVHSFVSCMSMSVSVDETLLPRQVNLSTTG